MDEGKEPEGGKEGLPRRDFLKGVAVGAAVGAAVAGVGVGVPLLLRRPDALGGGTTLGDPADPIIVYVPDSTKDELVIWSGTEEAIRRDAGLVSRLKASGAG